MSHEILEHIIQLAENLTIDQQLELVEYLQAKLPAKLPRQEKLGDFPVIDLGPWPEGLSLRREDMYDDDGWQLS